MITALCLNPSLDRTLRVAGLRIGQTNRIAGEEEAPGGKGLNVARMLAAFGLEAQCLIFLPDAGRAVMEEACARWGCGLLAVPAEGTLRVNLKVLDEQSAQITELNAKGSPVGARQLDRMEELAARQARRSDWLCLCGSLPPGCPEDYYAKLISRVRKEAPGCRVALDCSGESLRLALREGPDLIKPNLEELADWTGKPVHSQGQIEEALRALRQMGAGEIILSMGAEGARLDTEHGGWFAPGLNVPVASTVGAGDAMLSGYIAARERGLDGAEAFRLSAAAAAARVAGQPEEWENYLKIAEVWPL